MPNSTQEAATKTPPQLAKLWKCKPHTILGFIHRGELEAFDISADANSGRPRWRIHRDAILAFERRRSAGAKANAKRELRRRRRRKRGILNLKQTNNTEEIAGEAAHELKRETFKTSSAIEPIKERTLAKR